MKFLKAISTAWRNRPKKTLADLNDWALAFIGGPSFLIGTFYVSVAWKSTPELISLSQDHGLPPAAILAFLLLGGAGIEWMVFFDSRPPVQRTALRA